MKRIIIVLFGLLILSCSTATKPNISVLYQLSTLRPELPALRDTSKLIAKEPLPIEVEVLFKKLYTLDPNLALEVGKLPEFQEGIGKKQVVALARLIQLVTNATNSQKDKLSEFMNVGLPTVRRYCTPLQAIFWVLEKNEYDPKWNPLDWRLNFLLDAAWRFSEENRWKDYKIVTERLNAPELVDYYEKNRFYYVSRADHVGNARLLFKHNQGQCVDVTVFTVDCLRKGGYKAWEIHVASPSGRHSYHAVTLFKVGDKDYIMDNGRPDPRGIVPKDEY